MGRPARGSTRSSSTGSPPPAGSGAALRFDTRRAPLVLGAVALVLALHGLGASDIVGDDEAREAGIVQDMVAGHVLWPRFNADLIPDKPTLYHSIAAVPCALFGFSETAVRLPA